jgi:hypothetical protein
MNENITKECIEVKPGQVWRDLNKRMPNRHCKVVSIEMAKAVMRECRPDGSDLLGLSLSTTTKISIRRMHKSSTGWALVQDEKCGQICSECGAVHVPGQNTLCTQ